MEAAVRSIKMWDAEAQKEVVLEVSHDEMDSLERDVRADPAVMSALKEYLDLCETSLAEGETSSPEPPASMGLFWRLLQSHNPIWPGTMGNKIRREIETRVFKGQDT